MENKTYWQYFNSCITTRYAQFSGRARRKEFWGYILFTTLFSQIFKYIDSYSLDYTGLSLRTFFILATIVPTIAVGVRRFHDTGKSGWTPIFFGSMTNLSTISIVLGSILNINFYKSIFNNNTIWAIFFTVVLVILGTYYIIIASRSGELGGNQYGPDPINPEQTNEIDLIGKE